jgi:hypothetical protein
MTTRYARRSGEGGPAGPVWGTIAHRRRSGIRPRTGILSTMARKTASPKAPKEPGRIKQMWQVFQMTRRYDKSSVWWMLLALLAPIVVGVLLAIFATGGNWLTGLLFVVAGVFAGILAFLIVLGRKAERRDRPT